MLKKVLIAGFSVCALGLAAFQDPGGRFTIDFPDGWAPMGNGASGIQAVQAPPTANVGGANCNAQSPDAPALASATQDQINSQFGQPLPAAAWASIAGIDPSAMTVTDAEARPVDGKIMQIATLALQPSATLAKAVTARLAFFPMPGRIVLAGCYAEPDKFDGLKDLFEKTVSSVRPLG